MAAKHARVDQRFPTGKRAVVTRAPDNEGRERLSWRLGDADLGGAFGWDSISDAHLRSVFKMLCEADKSAWEAMAGDGMGQIKSIPVGNLSSSAKRRLQEIQRDDEEWLHEIRLGSRPRMWGIRRQGIFHILWWDPNHRVCPAPLRNT